jgi:hypothetical protein
MHDFIIRCFPPVQVCGNYRQGLRLTKLMKAGGCRANEEFYARAFEIARRYKIMNPQKMRSNYGKMMCLLQDSKRQDVDMGGMNLVRKIQTVADFLKRRHGEGILGSEDLEDATRDLSDTDYDRSTLLILQADKRAAAARIGPGPGRLSTLSVSGRKSGLYFCMGAQGA